MLIVSLSTCFIKPYKRYDVKFFPSFYPQHTEEEFDRETHRGSRIKGWMAVSLEVSVKKIHKGVSLRPNEWNAESILKSKVLTLVAASWVAVFGY